MICRYPESSVGHGQLLPPLHQLIHYFLLSPFIKAMSEEQQPNQMKRGRWTTEEHVLFDRGCKIHGWGNWYDIALMIPTRTSTQVKTHANKLLTSKGNEELREWVEIKRQQQPQQRTGRRRKQGAVKQEHQQEGGNEALSSPMPLINSALKAQIIATLKSTTSTSNTTVLAPPALKREIQDDHDFALDQRQPNYSIQEEEAQSPLMSPGHRASELTKCLFYDGVDKPFNSNSTPTNQAMTQHASNNLTPSNQSTQTVSNSMVSNHPATHTVPGMASNHHLTHIVYNMTSPSNQETPTVSNTTSSMHHLIQLASVSNLTSASSSDQQATVPSVASNILAMPLPLVCDKMYSSYQVTQSAPIDNLALCHQASADASEMTNLMYNNVETPFNSNSTPMNQAMTQHASELTPSNQSTQMGYSIMASNYPATHAVPGTASDHHQTQSVYNITSTSNQATSSVANTSPTNISTQLVPVSNLTSASSNQQATVPSVASNIPAMPLPLVSNLMDSSHQATQRAPANNLASCNQASAPIVHIPPHNQETRSPGLLVDQPMNVPGIIATATTNQTSFQRSAAIITPDNQEAMQKMSSGDADRFDEALSLCNSINTGNWSVWSSPTKLQAPPASSVLQVLASEPRAGFVPVDQLARYYLDSTYIVGYPTKYDVLCDHINDVYRDYVGNRRLRLMAMTSLGEYIKTSSTFLVGSSVLKKREDVHRTRRFILEFMHSLMTCSPPCRFLAMDVTMGRWRELNGDYSSMKIQETLRECKEVLEQSIPVDGRLRF
jgi:hypothetical protein